VRRSTYHEVLKLHEAQQLLQTKGERKLAALVVLRASLAAQKKEMCASYIALSISHQWS
jgi:hypothetical protein